jgi:hypothetical protein
VVAVAGVGRPGTGDEIVEGLETGLSGGDEHGSMMRSARWGTTAAVHLADRGPWV